MLAYGSFRTSQLDLQLGGQSGNFGYFATFDNQSSDGHVANSAYHGDSFTGRFDYTPARGLDVCLQGKYFAGRKNEPGPLEAPLAGYWNDYKRGAIDLSLNQTGETDDWTLRLYRNFGHHVFSDGWDSDDFTNGLMARVTTRRLPNMVATAGLDYRYFGGSSAGWPQGDWHKSESALYLHADWLPKAALVIEGGMRLQFDSLYGQEACPQAGVVWHITPTLNWRAQVSKGFRSPQLSELYMFPPANAALLPERTWNYESGLEANILRNWSIDATIFKMIGSNLITTIPNPGQGFPFILSNTGTFDFWGLELGLKGRPLETVHVALSHAFLNAGGLTKGRPGHKWDGSLDLDLGSIHSHLQGQWVTDYFAADHSLSHLPNYFILSARVTLRVWRQLNVNLDLGNVFNALYLTYAEFPGIASGTYTMPGRHMTLGLNWQL